MTGAVAVRRWRRLLVPAIPLLLLGTAAACGDDDEEVARTGAPATVAGTGTTVPETRSDGTTPSTGTSDSSAADDPLVGAGVEDVEGPPTAAGTSLLADLRVAGQVGYDRVVFEFRGEGVPGWQVGYVDPPILSDGEGAEVDVEGGAYLQVRMTPASGVDLSLDFEEVYTGPDRVEGDTATVTEVVRTGDFEAVLTWVIGLDGETPFVVSALENPSRIVVDISAG